MDKIVELTGTVEKFRLVNPHSQLTFVVQDEDGKDVTWTLELGSPGRWARNGWGPHAFSAGDEISARVHPSRSGKPVGTPESITMMDGTVVGFGGNVISDQ